MSVKNFEVQHPSLPQNQDFLVFNAEWMEGESIRSLLTTQGSLHMMATMIVVPIVIGVLYEHVSKPALLVWFCLIALLTAYRWLFLNYYQNNLTTAETQIQLKFNARYSWTWPLTGLLWGSLVWLFFTKAPVFNQFVCWVVLAGIGGFATTGYAAHMKTMHRFVNTMLVVMLSGMLWHYLRDAKSAVDSFIYSIFPLQLVFWILLMLVGTRFNRAHRERMELIKGNLELIDSLKAETLRANQAVDTKNRFLASAAHDIRQPILALDLYASLLKSQPDMVDVLTEKIGLSTKSVIDMFDSLFDLARLDSGQLKISRDTVDVSELMQELHLQYAPPALAKNLKLKFHAGNFMLQTDHQLLKRILGNLLMNAIKFTNKGGVLLACRPTLQGVRFEVWDTGVGISPDQHAAVLREFYKAPKHTGTSEGFGLGLSIVTRLCEPLGFHFSMRSRVGRGSVFCIDVPHAGMDAKSP